MQVLTWTEKMFVRGGKKIDIVLEQPDAQMGYYRDVFVLAFPTPFSGTKQIVDWRLKANFPGPTHDGHMSCHDCASPTAPPPFPAGEWIIDPALVIDISNYMTSFIFIIMGIGLTIEGGIRNTTKMLKNGLTSDETTHILAIVIGLMAVFLGVIGTFMPGIESPIFIAFKGTLSIFAIIIIVIETLFVK